MSVTTLIKFKTFLSLAISTITLGGTTAVLAAELPIADAHVHYSHDSVDLTPPARVIELMREANLKFALVSSSDDNGTQLLSSIAPDLIVPGLRPYRLRGETGTWFNDNEALEYVEQLLQKNRYASIGEFHLYGDDADLPIPRRIVELAAQHNLLLHAHSDAAAVERLLAQNSQVKVLWAHSGFDAPEDIAAMLKKHDRLWADLAFRSEVGSGGQLSDDWKALFEAFPDRMMLGTDTFTPERMYYLPSHAESARVWLTSLPDELAEKVAWKNAYNLIMPLWEANRAAENSNSMNSTVATLQGICDAETATDEVIQTGNGHVHIMPTDTIKVSAPVSVMLTLCGDFPNDTQLNLDAIMPAHGHGTNYQPEHRLVERSANGVQYQVDGVVLHMPGDWQWQVNIKSPGNTSTFTQDFTVK